MTWPHRPLSIRWQIGALLVVSQLLAHALSMVVFTRVLGDFDAPLPVAIAANGLAPFISTARTIEAAGADTAGPIVEAAVRGDPRLLIVATFDPTSEGFGLPALAGQKALRMEFPDLAAERLGVEVSAAPFEWSDPLAVVRYTAGYRLEDGRWLVFVPGTDTIARSFPPYIAFLIVLLLALPLAASAVWAGSMLVAPLRRIAQATQKFGADLRLETPVRSGVREIDQLAASISAMQERIRELLKSRSLTLAAVGHDLRTPLTRMRLRAEALTEHGNVALEATATQPPAQVGAALLRDIAHMEVMVDDALSYIRSEQMVVDKRAIDLVALVQAACDEVEEAHGHGALDLRLQPSPRVIVHADGSSLARAVTNVLENAARFANRVVVSIVTGDAAVEIEIADDGPGIEPARRAKMFEPFQRDDASRSGAEGFGLGLAITRQIVERHDGKMKLETSALGGLKVTIRLRR